MSDPSKDWLTQFCLTNEKQFEDEDEYIRCLVLGNPGAGKTTFAATFPNSLWLNTDFGMTAVDEPLHKICFKRGEPILKVMHGLITAMETQTGPFAPDGIYSDVETFVIDSAHKLADLVYREVLKSMGQNDKDKAGFEGYRRFRDELIVIFDRLKTIPYHVVVTSAIGTKEKREAGLQKSDTERELVNMPLIEGSYREMIGYEFDEVYLAQPKTVGARIEYWMYTQPIRGWEHLLKSRAASHGDIPPATQNAHFDMYKKYLAKRKGGASGTI